MGDNALLKALTDRADAMEAAEVRALIRAFEDQIKRNGLAFYRPYTKQLAFHATGKTHAERLLIAANQVGKTVCAGAEMSMHLTGRYPRWWNGKVFDRPVVTWVAGVSAEATRDNPQRILLGRPNEWGTGMIPKDAFLESPSLNRSVADGVDTLLVRNGGGGDVQAGESVLTFKNYLQGRLKFQGETLDIGWCDEEPPDDVYGEFMTRLQAKVDAFMMMTFTPLLGMTKVVKRFLIEKVVGSCFINMTLEDAEHYSPERRKVIEARIPIHMRDARARGIPLLGSGAVFPVLEEQIVVEPFPIPSHWARIAGIDFGWTHPTAVVWLAWDRDTDTIYVTRVYRQSEASVATHADAIRSQGDWLPIAWPSDGNNDTAAGAALATQYRDKGLNFLPTHATLPDNPGEAKDNADTSKVSVEAGVGIMLDRMMNGTWKVFKTATDWIEEFRMYHRENGKIVKLDDDAISASRYAMMMLRYSVVPPVNKAKNALAHRPVNWRAA